MIDVFINRLAEVLAYGIAVLSVTGLDIHHLLAKNLLACSIYLNL